MKLKKLKLEKELEVYRHAIANHIDVLLPLDYLKNGDVYGYFNKKNEICGGFAIINQGPFRVLESIPNFKGLSFDPKLSQTAEITGVWLSSLNQSKFASLKFWTSLILKVLMSPKKNFVYAYSTKKTGLKNIYKRAHPEVLFCGETKILPGMPSPDHESVEVVFKNRIIKQTFKNPDFFLKRMMKKKSRRLPPKKKNHFEQFEPTFAPLSDGFQTLQARENKIK